MINKNLFSYNSNLPSPSSTQNKGQEKLTLRWDRGRHQKAQRKKKTDRIFHSAHWILKPTSRWWASWSENILFRIFSLTDWNLVILLQPIKRGSQSVVFFLIGHLLLWCQQKVFVTFYFKYIIHWGQLDYSNHFTNRLNKFINNS